MAVIGGGVPLAVNMGVGLGVGVGVKGMNVGVGVDGKSIKEVFSNRGKC